MRAMIVQCAACQARFKIADEKVTERGVKVLALTDHDDVDGLDEARAAAAQHGMTFINGVEIVGGIDRRAELRAAIGM